MGFWLIISVFTGLMGVSHIALIVWTKANKDKLISTHKKGTLAHEMILKSLRLRRLLWAGCLAIFGIVLSFILGQNILDKYEDTGLSTITTALVVALLLMSIPLYTFHTIYKKK